ncbi:hypothetical protein IVB22_09040 [Bradyrhizobium sp. 190]|uniref:DUF2171 domain-containing protein n=1 Tax=Bradyrhizobium sp. 190 TaxID=2782658 RepID=UPI001FFB08BE|nr:DUF2171 domain-containing protein [Bradyrhizobium sp. 190]MCK1512720.1 hypothetical protein [Bradyrhizobium sp. 190]
MTEIKEHMEVIGADGVHYHFIDKGLVAGVEGNKVRLSANADVAVTMEEEK